VQRALTSIFPLPPSTTSASCRYPAERRRKSLSPPRVETRCRPSPRRHQQRAPLRTRQMNGRGGQECPVGHPDVRPRNLPAQDLELVPQHQLDVFHVQATPATNKRAQQSPNGEVEEGEGHAPDSPNPLAPRRRHRYWRPSRARASDAHHRTAFPDTGAAEPRAPGRSRESRRGARDRVPDAMRCRRFVRRALVMAAPPVVSCRRSCRPPRRSGR
jgi:hypothetical protein